MLENSKKDMLVKTLMNTELAHKKLLEKELSDVGVHSGQFKIIMFLRERKNNPPSQKDIAEAFGISSAAVAISIKKLEDVGLVSKNVFDKDNRVNNITLTEKGLKTADITTETVYKAFDRVFSVLSGDEIITMCKCLEKINNACKSLFHIPT